MGEITVDTSQTAEHDHGGFEIPPDFQDPAGRPVDHDLLGQLLGTAFDGCQKCQEPLLTRVSEHAVTSARLVELACVGIHQMLGGLPRVLTDAEAPGAASQAFRRLAAAGVDGANAEMQAVCAEMAPGVRRTAVETALDLLVGQMTTQN